MGFALPFRQKSPQSSGGRSRVLGIPLSVLFIAGVIAAVWLLRPLLEPAPPTLKNPVTVLDGDSFRTGDQTIRIVNIDAPELQQTCRDEQNREWPCGRVARQRLAALTAKGDVACTEHGRDRFGRTLASCKAGDSGDIGEVMVREVFGGETLTLIPFWIIFLQPRPTQGTSDQRHETRGGVRWPLVTRRRGVIGGGPSCA
jgi:hypothetical protein